MSTPSLTVRLEPALRFLVTNPKANNAYLATRFHAESSELDSWLKTHNGGSRVLTAARIDEVKRTGGGLVVTPRADVTKIAPVIPAKAPAPAPVKISSTSDLERWLLAQRVKITTRINSFQVEVTPELAGSWLQFNINNRKPSRAKIRRFTAAMKAGKWALNGETVKFSITGRLIDGQSRLMACIEAGVAVVLEVRAGLPDVAQESMDCGELRKGSHTLEMMGEGNPILMASALKLCWRWDHGWLTGVPVGRSRVVENGEMRPLLQRHPLLKTSAGWVLAEASKIKKLLRASEAAFFHYILGLADVETRDAFFEGLVDGVGLTKVSPVYHLRDRLVAGRSKWAGHNHCIERYAVIIKAWNAVVAGRPMSDLKFVRKGPAAEKFPEIAGIKKTA